MHHYHRSIITGALSLGIVLLNACSPWGCESGSGEVIRKELSIEAFHGIHVQGSLDVLVTKGEVQQVEIEGQTNLIELVKTDVKDGIWTITTTKCFSTNEPLRVHITVPALDHVVVQGSGSVKGESEFQVGEAELEIQGSGDIDMALVAGRIIASIQGSGDIRLRGSAGKLIASVEGSGDIRAEELIAGDVEAEVVGSGDIRVQASGMLDAEITGSGDVKYVGEPATIEQSITGSGDIERIKQ